MTSLKGVSTSAAVETRGTDLTQQNQTLITEGDPKLQTVFWLVL